MLVKSGPRCGLHPPSGLQKQTILSLVSESFMVYRGCGKTSEQTHEVHSNTSSSQYSKDYARLPNRAPEKLNFPQQINLKCDSTGRDLLPSNNQSVNKPQK